MQRYFILVSYRGTAYHGWQSQPNALSVQKIMESKLAQVLRIPVPIYGSSRTDAGVHAAGQVAHIDLPANINISQCLRSWNAVLPQDIVVRYIWLVDKLAHARFSALHRTYLYRIMYQRDPFQIDTCYIWRRGQLNLPAMQQAAKHMLGTHNFKGFSKIGSSPSNFLCNVMDVKLIMDSDVIIFKIQANRFLRGMVRHITGYLLQVGLGKLPTNPWDLYHTKPVLVPANGLTLYKVGYPIEIECPLKTKL